MYLLIEWHYLPALVHTFLQRLVAECLTVASGIFAMLGVASHLSVAAMESFASTFQMPIVIPSDVEPTSLPPSTAARRRPSSSLPPESTPDAPQAPHRPAAADRTYTIYVRPAYDAAVFALIRHYDWKHFYYLYDTEQGLNLSFPSPPVQF